MASLRKCPRVPAELPQTTNADKYQRPGSQNSLTAAIAAPDGGQTTNLLDNNDDSHNSSKFIKS